MSNTFVTVFVNLCYQNPAVYYLFMLVHFTVH